MLISKYNIGIFLSYFFGSGVGDDGDDSDNDSGNDGRDGGDDSGSGGGSNSDESVIKTKC